MAFLVTGPRQSGKSTLVQALLPGAPYVTFDDAIPRAAANRDAADFLRNLPAPAVLDEVQRVPDLFLAIKAEVDRRRTPGRFVLTGSADVMLLPRISESLAGRMEMFTLWPLSQGEFAGAREGFIDPVFAEGGLPSMIAAADRSGLIARALRGGYPEVLQRASGDRQRAWFRGYTTSMLQREIREISAIEGLDEIPRLLQICATRAGSLLNAATISRDIGMPLTTVRRYLALLQATFLLRELPAWSQNAGRRVVHTPKLYLADTGLLGYLAGLRAGDDRALGALLENFVVMELAKQRAWNALEVNLLFYRNHAGQEVDIVLESRDGRIVGIEVKASVSLQARDWRGLEVLRDGAQERFVRGLVLHAGDQVLPLGDRLWAAPMDLLWRLGAEPIARAMRGRPPA